MFLFYYVLFVDTSSNLGDESILKGGEQYNNGDGIILKWAATLLVTMELLLNQCYCYKSIEDVLRTQKSQSTNCNQAMY